MNRYYVIYDGRARGGQGTDDAAILFSVGYDRQEAEAAMTGYGDCALYSYVLVRGALIGERWERDSK